MKMITKKTPEVSATHETNSGFKQIGPMDTYRWWFYTWVGQLTNADCHHVSTAVRPPAAWSHLSHQRLSFRHWLSSLQSAADQHWVPSTKINEQTNWTVRLSLSFGHYPVCRMHIISIFSPGSLDAYGFSPSSCWCCVRAPPCLRLGLVARVRQALSTTRPAWNGHVQYSKKYCTWCCIYTNSLMWTCTIVNQVAIKVNIILHLLTPKKQQYSHNSIFENKKQSAFYTATKNTVQYSSSLISEPNDIN